MVALPTCFWYRGVLVCSFDGDLWVKVLVSGRSFFRYLNTFILEEWNGFCNWILLMVELWVCCWYMDSFYN
jgi:hypothetical protein